MREEPRPFAYHVSDAALDDLRRRLAGTRWLEPPGGGWGFGTDVAYRRDLVAYWFGAFDWRKREALLDAVMPGQRVRTGEMPRGGHFPALEALDDLVSELRALFRDIRFGT